METRKLEEGVIGALLLSNEFRDVVFSLSTANYFPSLGFIFNECENQYVDGISFTQDTIQAKVGDQGTLLYDIQFNAYNDETRITDAIRLLQGEYERKLIISKLQQTLESQEGKTVDELLAEIDTISQLDVTKNETSLTPSEILAREETSPKKEKLLTGHYEIDEKLFEGAGTCKGDVLTLLAESGHGKTQGALFLAACWAMKGYSGVWLQLEDYDVNTANALVSSALMGADNIFINDQLDEINAIKRECMRINHAHGLDFVVIDYMQIVKIKDDRKRPSKTVELEDIGDIIKDIAKSLNVVVVVTSQASVAKDRYGWNRIPRVDDAKWAQSIKEMSHAVVSVFRPNMVDGIGNGEVDGIKYVKDVSGNETYPFNSVFFKKRKDRRAPLYMNMTHCIHTEDRGLQIYSKGY